MCGERLFPMPTLSQRIAKLRPYFKSGKRGIVVAMLASLIAALTEPVLPALMKPLLDSGFGQSGIPLWSVPAVIIGLFVAAQRCAGFVGQYALAWTASEGGAEPAPGHVRAPAATRTPACSRARPPAG